MASNYINSPSPEIISVSTCCATHHEPSTNSLHPSTLSNFYHHNLIIMARTKVFPLFPRILTCSKLHASPPEEKHLVNNLPPKQLANPLPYGPSSYSMLTCLGLWGSQETPSISSWNSRSPRNTSIPKIH